jgi:hypothetical protein
MNHCPYIGPTLQCPASRDFQPVSLVPRYKLPFSTADYGLHLETFTFEHNTCQPWMHRDDSPNDTLYSSTSTPARNMSFEAAIDEFQPSGRLREFDTPMATSNGLLLFQSSIFDAQFLQASQVSQPQLDNLCNMDSSWPRPQSSSQAKQQITLNPQFSAMEMPKLLAIAMPKSRAPKSPESPKKFKDHGKRSFSCPRASASSTTSPKPSPRSRAKSRKVNHTVIEKRYRTNLSEKIALLRDSIPSLRSMDNEVSICDTTMPDNLRGSLAMRNLKKVSQVIVIPRRVVGTDGIVSNERQQSSRKPRSIFATLKFITPTCSGSGKNSETASGLLRPCLCQDPAATRMRTAILTP